MAQCSGACYLASYLLPLLNPNAHGTRTAVAYAVYRDRVHGPPAGCGVVCQERSCDRWSAE
jgi:hypothetical protein